MISTLRPALVLFGALTVACGVAYPLAVTGVASAVFPQQAAGEQLLIGQEFTAPRYFWGRPSATAPTPYNAAGSGGSNLGPLNPAFTDAVRSRVDALRAADPGNTAPIPVDLVTASGSGLDPEISLAGAHYQARRVANARGMPLAQVDALVRQLATEPVLGVFGEARVNVLALNLALDGKTTHTR